MILFAIACLAVAVGAMEAQAGYTNMFGSTTFGTPSVVSVNLSTYVYCSYYGTAQLYSAVCHNKAGDKEYATGGGGENASGIFFHQETNYIGTTAADPGGLLSDENFKAGSGWIAQ